MAGLPWPFTRLKATLFELQIEAHRQNVLGTFCAGLVPIEGQVFDSSVWMYFYVTHTPTRLSVYGPSFDSFTLDGKCDAEFTCALRCQFSVQLLAAMKSESCGVLTRGEMSTGNARDRILLALHLPLEDSQVGLKLKESIKALGNH